MKDAVILIIKDPLGRYLFIRRHPNDSFGGYWCPISGAVEPGEDHAATVAREAREETGIEVRPVRKVGEMPTRNGEYLLHWWIAELVSGEARVAEPNAIDAVAWAYPHEFESLRPNFEEDMEFIRKQDLIRS